MVTVGLREVPIPHSTDAPSSSSGVPLLPIPTESRLGRLTVSVYGGVAMFVRPDAGLRDGYGYHGPSVSSLVLVDEATYTVGGLQAVAA